MKLLVLIALLVIPVICNAHDCCEEHEVNDWKKWDAKIQEAVDRSNSKLSMTPCLVALVKADSLIHAVDFRKDLKLREYLEWSKYCSESLGVK